MLPIIVCTSRFLKFWVFISYQILCNSLFIFDELKILFYTKATTIDIKLQLSVPSKNFLLCYWRTGTLDFPLTYFIQVDNKFSLDSLIFFLLSCRNKNSLSRTFN